MQIENDQYGLAIETLPAALRKALSEGETSRRANYSLDALIEELNQSTKRLKNIICISAFTPIAIKILLFRSLEALITNRLINLGSYA